MTVNTELYHFGVKGMRWGHRKARPRMSGAARSARSARRKKIAKRVALGLGAAAGAAALGYGAYKYGKNPVNRANLDVAYRNARMKAGNAADMVRAHGGPIGAARELHRRHNTPMAKAQRDIKRMKRGDRLSDAAGRVANVASQAKFLGVKGSARAAGQIGKQQAGAASKAVGGYVLGGKHSKTRSNLRSAGSAIKNAPSDIRKQAGAASKAVGGFVLGGKHSKTRSNLRSAGSAVKNTSSDIRKKVRQGRAAAETLASAYQTRRKYQGKHASHFAYDSPGEALYHFALDPYGRYAIL